jgi:hypothetical protein
MPKKVIIPLLLSFLLVAIFDDAEFQLRKAYPSPAYSLFRGTSFNSIDNEYYLSYTNNYLKGHGWRFSMYSMQNSDEPVGKGSYFRRVPGYPLLYFVFVSLFGYHWGLVVLIIVQHLLFFASVYCFYQILCFLRFSKIVKILMMSSYIILPYFYSYAFYTLTESISPLLFIFFLYFLLKANNREKDKVLNYAIASFFLGYAILTRPYMGLAGLILLYFLNKDYPITQKLQHLKTNFLIFAVAGVMLMTWAVRNWLITGKLVFLEKATHPENLDRVKPEFNALWNFVKCWEPDGDKMNEIHLGMFYAAIKKGDTSQVYREKFVAKIPNYITQIIDKTEINQSLIAYQTLLLSQKPYFDKNIPMPSEYTAEQWKVAALFDGFVSRFKQRYPFRYYVLNPLKQLGLIVLHSNTAHIYCFQEPFRHIQILNIVRYCLVVFHISLYVIMFLNLWWIRTNFKETLIVSITPLLLVLFFMFIFQAVEQRYMLPFLPALFVGLGFFLQKTNLVDKTIKLCKSLTLKTNDSLSAT